MAKTLVVAEKPSVGRDLASALPGKFDKDEGFLESDEYVITWAVGHLVQLALAGNIVAMFPEGTRRTKGLVKRFEARPRTGAARIALEAGVPLVPAAVRGTDHLRRFAPISVVYGAPVDIDDLRGAADLREAAQVATDRLMARIEELEASL